MDNHEFPWSAEQAELMVELGDVCLEYARVVRMSESTEGSMSMLTPFVALAHFEKILPDLERLAKSLTAWESFNDFLIEFLGEFIERRPMIVAWRAAFAEASQAATIENPNIDMSDFPADTFAKGAGWLLAQVDTFELLGNDMAYIGRQILSVYRLRDASTKAT